MSNVKQWMNYIIIGIISFIALVFLPTIGSSAAVGIILPTTIAGWAVWITTKLIVAVINILIFHCFVMQGRDTAKETDEYKEAQKILKIINPKQKTKILAPEIWTAREYKTKGLTIFLTSAASVFALSQAILTYDWISMLTYLFVIIFGIVFGILEQRKVFDKWSVGYLEYANFLLEEKQEEQREEEETRKELEKRRIKQEQEKEEVMARKPKPKPNSYNNNYNNNYNKKGKPSNNYNKGGARKNNYGGKSK